MPLVTDLTIVALEMQNALVFEPVWRIITREKRSAVSIKVGQESVQVIYVRVYFDKTDFQAEEQQVTSTSRTPLCDVIFAVDIDEINVSSYVSDENEFVLKGKGIRLVFSSPKRHDIIQVCNSLDLVDTRRFKLFELLHRIVNLCSLRNEVNDLEVFRGRY